MPVFHLLRSCFTRVLARLPRKRVPPPRERESERAGRLCRPAEARDQSRDDDNDNGGGGD